MCTQENLNKALSMVGKIVNKNTALPILNNVLLKTDKGRLKLNSTNLEIGVSYWIGGKIEEEGEITVPTRLFSSFISSLPGGNVEIKLKEENTLNVKCGGYKTSIKGLSAKEYPLTPKIESKPVFKIRSSEFKQALSQVLPAVSSSEARVEITGVFLDLSRLSENKLILAATDSYRLAEKTLNLEKGNSDKEILNLLGSINSVIIPKNTIQELVRDLDEEEEMLEIVISENQILFNFGSASIISRLIEGKYPDYKQVIPNKFEAKVKVGKNEISNAIKVASLFVGVSNNSIEFELLPNSKSLRVSSETSEIGSSDTKIPAEVSGKELKVIYNYKYLMDGFNSIEGDSAFLEINSGIIPTVLKSASDKSFLYVIMPIRT